MICTEHFTLGNYIVNEMKFIAKILTSTVHEAKKEDIQ
jgi:hypothetical protein